MTNLFKVKQSDSKELLKRVLSCQQHDEKTIELIKTKGLRVEPIPTVEDEPKWEPSGLYNPNSWRKKH